MTSQYRHRRTSNPATAFPNPIEPGEIAVNTANRQIVVGDAQSGVTGAPLALLALRFFDARAIYAAGDMVYQAGVVYRAKAACGPETFNPAHWDVLAGAIDPLYVQKAGDIMSGPLYLPAAMPAAPEEAAHKAYVDLGLSGKSVVISQTTAPAVAGYPDNTLWYESDSGVLFLLYNDGDTRQWVIASPQPDPGTFVAKSGDTMTGLLVLSGDPVTPLGAATGQYAIAVAAAAANTRVNKTGDAMTGPLSIPIAPLTNSEVTNKLYVDSAVNAKSSTVISDTPPAGAPDGTIWYESDSGLTYVRYNDGNSSQWVALLSTAGNAVLYDAQVITAAQQAQARKNISAAPFDAMAYNGMQVNGSGEIDQALAGNVTASANYFTDGWLIYYGGALSLLASTYTSGPVPGFSSYVRLWVTTPVAALAAGDYGCILQRLEGYRTMRVAWGAANPQPITIGFWVMVPVAGNIAVHIANQTGDRSYIVDVACAANIWEWKTVTIPGCPDGTWLTTTGTGIQVMFCFGAGSNNQGVANTWLSSFKFATAQTTNQMGTAGTMSRICGLVVLPGTDAPSAARSAFVQRSFDEELRLCQRYYEKDYDYAVAPGAAIGANFIEQYIPIGIGNCQGNYVPFRTRKRVQSTMRIFSTTGVQGNATGISVGQKAVAIDSANEGGYSIYVSVAAADLYRWHHVADARL